MGFATFQELLDKLELTALARGMDATHPIIVTMNSTDTNNEANRFVVGYSEPTGLDLPLNILWYVRDPGSADYNKLLRRNSRSPSGGYSGTWINQSDVIEVLTTLQIWDQPIPSYQDLYDHASTAGNVHDLEADDIGAVGPEGGTLTGPLHIRDEGVGYALTEAVQRSWVETALDVMRSITENIIQSFDNINAQIDNLRTRVEILELSLLGLKGFIYNAVTASATWNIQHNMNNTNVVIQVYEGNDVVLPHKISVVDPDNVQILFAVPVAGHAEILPVIELA